MAKNKPDVVTLPLKTEQATVAVEAKVPAVLLDTQSAPPTTTAQQDLVTLRQSRINFIWEGTQAFITSVITLAAIYCAINNIESDIINFAFVAIISTYYARTNHTRIGGIGYKPVGESR